MRLSARGVGLAQAANGVGKIAGPLCLALIAGASNLITPKATIEAVTPAFLFLAGCGLAIGLAFSLLGDRNAWQTAGDRGWRSSAFPARKADDPKAGKLVSSASTSKAQGTEFNNEQ